MAFTEQGVAMLSSVLKSDRAIAMSIYVIKAFMKMREELMANETVLRRLAEIDQTLLLHDEGLRDLYQKLIPLLEPGPEPARRKIGPLRPAPAHSGKSLRDGWHCRLRGGIGF
jgi:hypothetical protein